MREYRGSPVGSEPMPVDEYIAQQERHGVDWDAEFAARQKALEDRRKAISKPLRKEEKPNGSVPQLSIARRR